MGLNRAVARTIEQELQDPNSLLSIDMNNAILNRNLLLQELKIKDFEYASYLAAKEKADEADSERAEYRRAEQEALLRRSSEEYYAEQKKIAEHALVFGLKPLSMYDLFMTSIFDFQLQLNAIAVQLVNTQAKIQQAQTNYAVAAAAWQNKRAAHLDSYFDTAYQIGGMDLNGEYGHVFSSEQERQTVRNIRSEGKERAAALSPLPSDANQAAVARHRIAVDLLGFNPFRDEINFWLNVQPEAQRDLFRQRHGGVIRFTKVLVRQTQNQSAVKQQHDELLGMEYAMALLRKTLKDLEQDKRELHDRQETVHRDRAKAFREAGDVAAQQGHSQKATRLYELGQDGMYSELSAEPSLRAGSR